MANDVSKLIWGPGQMVIGTENQATPSGTDVGMPAEMGYDLIIKPSFKRVKSGAYLLAVGLIPSDLEILVEGAIMESSMANIGAIISTGSLASLTESIGGTGAVVVQSILITGTKFPGGTATRKVTLSRGVFIQEFRHPFKLGEEWAFPFQFSALQGTTTPTYTIVDSA